MGFFKKNKHLVHFFFPIFLTYFLMNAFVAEYSHLPVFYSYVHQSTVTVSRLIHSKIKEKFVGAVDRIHELAAGFHVDTHLTTRTLFGSTNGFGDRILFCLSKK